MNSNDSNANDVNNNTLHALRCGDTRLWYACVCAVRFRIRCMQYACVVHSVVHYHAERVKMARLFCIQSHESPSANHMAELPQVRDR